MSKKYNEGYKTLDEIRNCGKSMLTPEDVAQFLKCRAYNINVQANKDPSKLGFPVIVIGSRIKIPREGFVRFCEYSGIGAA